MSLHRLSILIPKLYVNMKLISKVLGLSAHKQRFDVRVVFSKNIELIDVANKSERD